jgi:hypothetical protein
LHLCVFALNSLQLRRTSLWTNRRASGSFDAPLATPMKLHISRFQKLQLTVLFALAISAAASAQQTFWLNQAEYG